MLEGIAEKKSWEISQGILKQIVQAFKNYVLAPRSAWIWVNKKNTTSYQYQ